MICWIWVMSNVFCLHLCLLHPQFVTFHVSRSVSFVVKCLCTLSPFPKILEETAISLLGDIRKGPEGDHGSCGLEPDKVFLLPLGSLSQTHWALVFGFRQLIDSSSYLYSTSSSIYNSRLAINFLVVANEKKSIRDNEDKGTFSSCYYIIVSCREQAIAGQGRWCTSGRKLLLQRLLYRHQNNFELSRLVLTPMFGSRLGQALAKLPQSRQF